MPDILLTHGYFLWEDEKEQQIMKPYPPLGILYLSSHLRRQGFGIEAYDSTFGSLQELSRLLETEPPAVIGVYGTLMTRRGVLAITAAAKQRGWTVVLGGPEPANYAAEYLARGADFVVEGEGEITLQELLAATRAGDELVGVALLHRIVDFDGVADGHGVSFSASTLQPAERWHKPLALPT